MHPPVIAEHVDHHYIQTIHAPPHDVFPLLCPVREKEWMPDWEARMIHSRSGLAEAGAVFASPRGTGETVWYTAAHEPDRHVRFVRFHPEGVVVDISIDVAPDGPDDSKVAVRYRFTATSDAGTATVRGFTAEAWLAMMETWEGLMNQWFAQRKNH